MLNPTGRSHGQGAASFTTCTETGSALGLEVDSRLCKVSGQEAQTALESDNEIVPGKGESLTMTSGCCNFISTAVESGHGQKITNHGTNGLEPSVSMRENEAMRVDENPPILSDGPHQQMKEQGPSYSQRDEAVSISLRGNADHNGEQEAREVSQDDEIPTCSENEDLHSLYSHQTEVLEPSLPARDHTGASRGERDDNASEQRQAQATFDNVLPAGKELQVLSCRCYQRADARILERPKAVVISLLENKYNCSAEDAQAKLDVDETKATKAWEDEAKIAGIPLNPPRQVIVCTDETASDDVRLQVPRQVTYVGTSLVIPNWLADTSCVDLGVDRMLQHLNETLRTTYTLDRPGLSSVLQSYADRGFDFGLAYGYLRHWWFESFTQLPETMRKRQAKDKWRRDRAIDGAYIVDRLMPPRRAWDLYSNRVLPWWILREWNDNFQSRGEMYGVDAISHSWVHPTDRQSVVTPINGGKWPVPIPNDTTLERIRVELLNVGKEIIWLDVLCLWQEGVMEDDEARFQEWELDVPTIGNVYQSDYVTSVVSYFNGLGRPFRICNLDDERHWLNRAWTLQEFNKHGIIGGLVPNSFPPRTDIDGRVVDDDLEVILFYQQLEAASNNIFRHPNVVLSVLAAMAPRRAAHVVDKVGGVTHILATDRIPKYIRGEKSCAAENAWNILIPAMDDDFRADLFFLYPARGSGKYAWCPSWNQVNDPLPPVPQFQLWGSLSGKHKEDGQFQCNGWWIEQSQVQGFATPDRLGRCRMGALRVILDDAEHSFATTAHHQEPIPDGPYTVIGDRSWDGQDVVVWVVGSFNSKKQFEKLSVLRTEDKEDILRLEKCGLVQRGGYFHSPKRLIELL